MRSIDSHDATQPSDETYSTTERGRLLGIARASIVHGLKSGDPLIPSLEALPAALCRLRACFVTLTKHGDLRGCIGTLEASRPLAEDVAENAWSAAARDPRFPTLTLRELAEVRIEISVLTPLEPMTFEDEGDLLDKIVPGEDGLLLRYGRHRGTFLPSVWEQLPDRSDFWRHLKRKAGLPGDFWSDGLECWRYHAIKISEGGTVAEDGP